MSALANMSTDFNGEYQGEEFDGLQVVGEEGRHGYDEGLGEDDAGEGAEWGHAHGDGCFVLPVVDGAERSSEVFRLVDGVVKDECGVNGPVGLTSKGFTVWPRIDVKRGARR